MMRKMYKTCLSFFFKMFSTKKEAPLLGRWCRSETHTNCDPILKQDWANIDNSASPMLGELRDAQGARLVQGRAAAPPFP